MRRIVLAFPVFVLALTAPAQTPPGKGAPVKDAPPGTPDPPPPAIGRTRLTASPAPVPVPALRYELLPRLRDRTPGNAAVGYLRAAVLRPSWPRDPKEGQELNEKTIRWEETPVDQLPVPEVKEFLKRYREMFREVDEAARMDHCDWQQAGRLRPEDIGAILPSVQANREMIRFLSFRCRVELAEKRYDDAVRTLQTGFQLAKNVGEGPTMIQMLVGIALGSVGVARAEELIAQPNGPNLYWALTALPRPFIDPRPAVEGETEFLTSFIPGLKDLEKGVVSEEQANRALEQSFLGLARAADADDGGKELADLAGAVGRAAFLAIQGPAAKKDLLARGWPKKDVDAMPAAQAVILRSVSLHRELWDDQVKQFFVPYPAAEDGMARAVKKVLERRKTHRDDTFFTVLSLAYPAVQKVHASHARLERRLALLRAVEAVRLHAALQNGTPPKDLADVTVVPVPDDPNTGKPFVYTAAGGTFTLTAPAPKGEEANPTNAYEYVVTVRK